MCRKATSLLQRTGNAPANLARLSFILGQTIDRQGYEKAKISIAFLFALDSEIPSWDRTE